MAGDVIRISVDDVPARQRLAYLHDFVASQIAGLEFEPKDARRSDPLMGWTSSTDMNGQVRLNFDTAEEAVAYAERHGIPFRLHEPQAAPVILKAYADNFAPGRKQPWTH